jgi:hypothetical protein
MQTTTNYTAAEPLETEYYFNHEILVFFCNVTKFGMRIRLPGRTSTTILATSVNSLGSGTYWQEHGVRFKTSLGVLCHVCGKIVEIYIILIANISETKKFHY